MTTTDPTTTVHLFHSTMKSCRYIFKDGTAANFVNGKFVTTMDSQIAELQDAIAKRHPHIFVKTGEETVDYDIADPIAALRKKLFAEFMAEQEAQKLAPPLELPPAVQGALNPTSTTDIAPVTIGAGASK